MSPSRKLIALVVVLLAMAAVAWLLLRSGDPTAFASGKRVHLADFRGTNPTGVPPSLAGADLVARGEYLTRAADCAACHTVMSWNPPKTVDHTQIPLAVAGYCIICHNGVEASGKRGSGHLRQPARH